MNELLAENIASNQSLMLIAVGVFGTLWVANRVYDIVNTKKAQNQPPPPPTPAIPTELLREMASNMVGLAKTLDGIDKDLSLIREHLHSVKETVSLIQARQQVERDR